MGKLEKALSECVYGKRKDIEEARLECFLDEPEKILKKDEFEEYLETRHRTDMIIPVRVGDLKVVKGPKNFEGYKEVLKVEAPTEEPSKEAYLNGVSQLYVAYPHEMRYILDAVGPTAFGSLFRAAGFEQSSALFRFNGTKQAAALDEEARCSILNSGLACYACYPKEIRMLMRDGKIKYFYSSLYGVISPLLAYSVFKEEVLTSHPDATFNEGRVGEMFEMARFSLNDKCAESDLSSRLGREVKLGGIFVTSELGASSCFAGYTARIAGTELRLGKPAKIKHVGSEVEKNFKDEVARLGMSLKEEEDRIEELCNIDIDDCVAVFEAVTAKNEPAAFLSAEAVKAVLPSLDGEGTALDVFLAINEAVEFMKSATTTERYLELLESASRLMWLDFTKYS